MSRTKWVGSSALIVLALSLSAGPSHSGNPPRGQGNRGGGGNRQGDQNGNRNNGYPRNALPGLTAAQIQLFRDGEAAFNAEEEAADGLGPIFNDVGCAVCHPNGGGSTRISNIIGLAGNGQFAAGGPVIQLQALPGFTAETVPTTLPVGQRRAMTTKGLGLIGGVADQDILNLQAQQANQTPALAGKANIVIDAVVGNQRVGRIGQKALHPNSTSFAAEAYLREMGITTPFFPNEEAPFNNPALLAGNPVPGLNDDGEDVLAFGFFMDHLRPPSAQNRTQAAAADIQAGAALFAAMGCAVCHQPTWTTVASADASLSRITFAPYSDFLLHDMGASGDQIPQGTDAAGQPIPGSWMRTTPLWGVGQLTKLWHDASVDTIPAAIHRHDGQGLEARTLFNNLTATQKQQVVAFLKSL